LRKVIPLTNPRWNLMQAAASGHRTSGLLSEQLKP
jgi:hypothetical protein